MQLFVFACSFAFVAVCWYQLAVSCVSCLSPTLPDCGCLHSLHAAVLFGGAHSSSSTCTQLAAIRCVALIGRRSLCFFSLNLRAGISSTQTAARVVRLQIKRVLWAWEIRGGVRKEVIVILFRVCVYRCRMTVHSESVIGVHVRHGDKKTESAIIPIEQYLETAKVSPSVASALTMMTCHCK
jgi:hypothetical protein